MRQMPIACVDLILEDQSSRILFGFRGIAPYRNKWALVGGRILHGEDLGTASTRISNEYGIKVDRDHLFLVGVFPIVFKERADIVIAVAAPGAEGIPVIDGKEFKRMSWSKKTPTGLGTNYNRMVAKWFAMRTNTALVRQCKID